MQQERLFVLAPEVVHFGATYVAGQGWHLTVVMRRQDEHWESAYRATYSHLATAELAQTIDGELYNLLGLA